MRRSIGWACALSALVLSGACRRDWESFDVGAGTGGTAGSDGGMGVGGGSCFPGAKVCPDPENPEDLLCMGGDDPAYGCGKATACAPCALPHATATCASGACAIDSCDTGWSDCNANPIDGCETDLNGDKNHCGACGNDCVVTKGGGWICESGVCAFNECCSSGSASCATKRDCDGNKANGCEVDVATDAQNCKTCGNACSLAHAASTCSQETCIVTACSSGWANCDMNDVNGCETSINQGDGANCGSCGKVCNQTNGASTCTGGSCALLCNFGFGNCNNNPDDGCEVDLKTSPLHCGGCTKACNPANVNAATCSNGGCDYTSCKAGFTDCDGNKANGCETNTSQDKNNCGTCGKVCTAPAGGSAVCSSGACATGCGSGLTNCSGLCVNLGNDANNCSSCGNKCSAPANATATCSSGACSFTCNNGWAKCGSSTQCFQIGADPKHCCSGAGCNTACASCPGPAVGSGNPACSSGACGIQCVPPTSGICASGCYNFQSDKAHCGGCTTACTDPSNGTNNCVSGTCVLTCNSGYTACSGGCYDLKSDKNHCGSCTTVCPNACISYVCT